MGAGDGAGRVERAREQRGCLLAVERLELHLGAGEDLCGLVGDARERDVGELRLGVVVSQDEHDLAAPQRPAVRCGEAAEVAGVVGCCRP